MINEENVIKGLEICTKIEITDFNECDKCPYYRNCLQLDKDALALLKEQKAIIEQYSRADGFLAAHGWKWDGGEME